MNDQTENMKLSVSLLTLSGFAQRRWSWWRWECLTHLAHDSLAGMEKNEE